jgi:hypothetical protein
MIRMSEADSQCAPGPGSLEQVQRRGLRNAMTSGGIDTGELWLRYFSIGGTVGEYEVGGYIESLIELPDLQRDLLAHAANERIDELPRPHAPYADELARLE